MRDALKNIFTHHITLGDNTSYSYTINPYELTNALGYVIAILQEYNFTKENDHNGQFSCKLYKTKDGNWYDFEEAKMGTEKATLRLLKLAIDAKGNDEIFWTENQIH